MHERVSLRGSAPCRKVANELLLRTEQARFVRQLHTRFLELLTRPVEPQCALLFGKLGDQSITKLREHARDHAAASALAH